MQRTLPKWRVDAQSTVNFSTFRHRKICRHQLGPPFAPQTWNTRDTSLPAWIAGVAGVGLEWWWVVLLRSDNLLVRPNTILSSAPLGLSLHETDSFVPFYPLANRRQAGFMFVNCKYMLAPLRD